jgi:1,6-anhydro-N-acetylmuramate kinase
MTIPNIEEFEERAAIAEYDGGLSRHRAEDIAAQGQGFPDADAYWQWLAEYVMAQRLP